MKVAVMDEENLFLKFDDDDSDDADDDTHDEDQGDEDEW